MGLLKKKTWSEGLCEGVKAIYPVQEVSLHRPR